MPRMIVALMRHGEYQQLPDTPSAHQPFALTEQGREQARQSASVLVDILTRERLTLCPDVDSSNLLRAWQTASILCGDLAASCDVPIRHRGFDALAERSLGSAANLTVDQIEKILAEDPRFEPAPANWKSDSHYRLPLQGAESLMQAGARVARHLDKATTTLAATAKSDTLKLVVGHGAAMRHAAHKLGVLRFDQIAELSMYHAEPVLLEYRPGRDWLHVGGEWKVRHQGDEHAD